MYAHLVLMLLRLPCYSVRAAVVAAGVLARHIVLVHGRTGCRLARNSAAVAAVFMRHMHLSFACLRSRACMVHVSVLLLLLLLFLRGLRMRRCCCHAGCCVIACVLLLHAFVVHVLPLLPCTHVTMHACLVVLLLRELCNSVYAAAVAAAVLVRHIVLLHGRTGCRLGCWYESFEVFFVALPFLRSACVSLRGLPSARIRCFAIAVCNISLQHLSMLLRAAAADVRSFGCCLPWVRVTSLPRLLLLPHACRLRIPGALSAAAAVGVSGWPVAALGQGRPLVTPRFCRKLLESAVPNPTRERCSSSADRRICSCRPTGRGGRAGVGSGCQAASSQPRKFDVLLAAFLLNRLPIVFPLRARGAAHVAGRR